MHIRAGFEIAYDCAGPTPMLLVLSIHPSRVPDLVTPHRISFDREVVPYDYVDGFGNVCTRIVATSTTGPACSVSGTGVVSTSR